MVKSAQGVFVIKDAEKTFMIPLHDNFIKERDIKNKRILFKNIDGLL